MKIEGSARSEKKTKGLIGQCGVEEIGRSVARHKSGIFYQGFASNYSALKIKSSRGGREGNIKGEVGGWSIQKSFNLSKGNRKTRIILKNYRRKLRKERKTY